jgi:hypothetical protein
MRAMRRHPFLSTLIGSRCLAAACVLTFVAAFTAFAAESRRGSVLTITEENDLVVKTDRHYTQGLRLTLLLDDAYPRWADSWMKKLPQMRMRDAVNKFGVAVGQNIYTPRDTLTSALLKDDRPYAAWLYLGAIWQRRGMLGERMAALDSAELDLGIVGRAALGEDAQTWVHQVRGFEVPKGWHHQLRNEPAVQLRLARQWRFSAGARDGFSADVIPELGASLGNVATTGNAGAVVRFGFNVPDDFGVQTIDSLPSNSDARSAEDRNRFGLYGFAGVEGRLVGYTTFLDGNMFRASHSIEKQWWVADFKIGCVAVFKYCDVWFSYVLRTREFVGQGDTNTFGSAGISVKF